MLVPNARDRAAATWAGRAGACDAPVPADPMAGGRGPAAGALPPGAGPAAAFGKPGPGPGAGPAGFMDAGGDGPGLPMPVPGLPVAAPGPPGEPAHGGGPPGPPGPVGRPEPSGPAAGAGSVPGPAWATRWNSVELSVAVIARTPPGLPPGSGGKKLGGPEIGLTTRSSAKRQQAPVTLKLRGPERGESWGVP